MKIISFGWTAPAISVKRKHCTRRNWKDSYAESFHKGDVCQAYDKSPRCHGNRMTLIRLTADPGKEPERDIPDEDWENEGFAYLTEIGAKVNGLEPVALWDQWKRSPDSSWVIRFEYLEEM